MKLLMTLALLAGLNTLPAQATDASNETMGEKASVQANKAKRSVQKGYHRTKEAVCMKGDLECAAQKAKHRGSEMKEAAQDKAEEIKDKVD